VKLTRRQLLIGGAATATAGLGGWRACWYPGARAFRGLAVLSPRQGVILAAAFDALWPDEAARDDATMREHVAAADVFLVGLDAGDLAQLDQLLYALEHATLPFGGYFRRFSSLPRAARREVLADWRGAGMAQRRLGFRTLKAVAFLVYYRTPPAWAQVRYGGPILPGGNASPELGARYDGLRAPPGARPGFP
jgi:hypothetical protein